MSIKKTILEEKARETKTRIDEILLILDIEPGSEASKNRKESLDMIKSKINDLDSIHKDIVVFTRKQIKLSVLKGKQVEVFLIREIHALDIELARLEHELDTYK